MSTSCSRIDVSGGSCSRGMSRWRIGGRPFRWWFRTLRLSRWKRNKTVC
jgi:hypothetical protein